MTTYVGASEASRLLGVTKATLYAYVSRGLIERRTAVDGRSSLYDRDAVERLSRRSRKRPPVERPSIDVQITSAITQLGDEAVEFRGRDAAELARTSSFEQVAELLWTGDLPAEPPSWPLDPEALARCGAVVDAAGRPDPLTSLALAANTLRSDDGPPTAAATARRLLTVAPSLLGGPKRGDLAHRLAAAWSPGRSGPHPAVIEAVSRALVLLADHELATSTLAVRVAASVRAAPSAALAAGFDVVSGQLHGAASEDSRALFAEAGAHGADIAVDRCLAAGRRLSGFGHTVYRSGDPRFAPLLEAVRAIPDRTDRQRTIDDVLRAAGRVVGHLPNVDLALGALTYVADFPPGSPLFAIARIAGWAAHYDEELQERPVRYRGLTRHR